MEDLRRHVEALQKDVVSLRRELQVRDERIAEFEAELKRRGKKYRPRANAKKQAKQIPDRRRTSHRKHPGSLHELREELSRHRMRKYVEPLIASFEDAIALSKSRDTMSDRKYQAACTLALRTHSLQSIAIRAQDALNSYVKGRYAIIE